MAVIRSAQLAYSEIQCAMLDEAGRRQKAGKILAVLRHFLDRADLRGLDVLDLGTSTGFIASELARAGGQVTGVDIDEPGLARARERFGHEVEFLPASGDQLPLPDRSVDVVVFNHIYEHVVDADAVMDEIRRVLRPHGIVYLGLGNRLGVVEPHYKLPFLSYLPPAVANVYVRAAIRAEGYHERFRTGRGLRRMVHDLFVWDYTLPIIADPDRFCARDIVPEALSKVPAGVLDCAKGLLPTYIWIGSPSPNGPRGPQLSVHPVPVATQPPSVASASFGAAGASPGRGGAVVGASRAAGVDDELLVDAG